LLLRHHRGIDPDGWRCANESLLSAACARICFVRIAWSCLPAGNVDCRRPCMALRENGITGDRRL